VIFTNPRLELEPAIEARPDVFSWRELNGYLGQRSEKSPAGRVFSSVVQFCLDSEAKIGGSLLQALFGRGTDDPYERIVACLSETGTWDQLQYVGGKVVTGDLLELRVGPRTYRRPEVLETSGPRPIRLRWTRNRWTGLFKAVTGLGSLGTLSLGKTRVTLSTHDSLKFHPVGEREPSTFRLVEFDGITLG